MDNIMLDQPCLNARPAYEKNIYMWDPAERNSEGGKIFTDLDTIDGHE